jgi:hypothetical protein
MRTLLIALLCTAALAAPPFGTEQGHYQLDFDGDKIQDEVWLVTIPQKLPTTLVIVNPFPSDKGKPKPGKLGLLVKRQKKLYLLTANEFFSSPIWQQKDIAGQVRVDGKRLAIFTESGADMFILWNGKTFVSEASPDGD